MGRPSLKARAAIALDSMPNGNGHLPAAATNGNRISQVRGEIKPPKPTSAKPEKSREVHMLRPDVRVIRVLIEGVTSLITNKFGHEAETAIRGKTEGRIVEKKIKDPDKIFHGSYYPMPGLKKKKQYGMPVGAFKGAMVTACSFTQKAVFKTIARGAFHVDEDAGGLVEINCKSGPRHRIDPGRNPNTGGAVILHRAEFVDWSAVLTIRFDHSVIQPDHIVTLLERAGFSVGIGEWRPERDGTHGCFRVKQIMNDRPNARPNGQSKVGV